ncbi:PTS system, lactose/cellobiose family IIC subunit [Clostridium sp. DL-VIII]|uniref:PTS sugar transporter subunit IIC n=1 Tax=Clostridium sp. DL-VIII TaxID=641107 RepID=UPI00023B066F|nr:PTS sugar transporter subunit IIC [Clostridium sp. DL-VIII]EHJ02075.1 PTS system, lactose/cellobiose family IIC subunit [Clostridium sp. DL-VIII]
MSVNQTLNEKVVPAVMKFVNLKGLQALKDGILFTLPLNIVGSIFLLIAAFPWKPFTDFMTGIFGPSWNEPLYKVQHGTMGIMALVAVIGIAYIYAKNEGVEPFSCAVISLAVFMIVTNEYTMFAADPSATPIKVGGVLSQDWMGGKGMITAIIISLVVGAIYSALINKNITIKMPEGVPQGVVNGFAALIPAAIIFTGACVIYAVLEFVFNTSFSELIYKVVQTPLQAASDSPFGAILIAFAVPFLWFFGIHGGVTVSGVVTALLQANTADNANLQAAGTLDLAHGAHIVTQQFYDNFINLTGSGQTLAFTILLVVFAKSAQYKQLGRLALPANIFNINEPILFGTPVVLNPMMAVPFIFTPVINAILLYVAISSHILAPMGGAMPPWTVPTIFSGFIIGGPSYAIAQFVFLITSALIYFPFFKKVDAMAFADELAAQHGKGVEA